MGVVVNLGVIAVAVRHMLAGGMTSEAIREAVKEMEGIFPRKEKIIQDQRAKRLSSDWHPSEILWNWGKFELSLSEDTLKFETSAFRDHFLSAPNGKGVKIDWDRTWKNWMREAVRRGKRSQQRKSQMASVLDRMVEKARTYDGETDSGAAKVVDISDYSR